MSFLPARVSLNTTFHENNCKNLQPTTAKKSLLNTIYHAGGVFKFLFDCKSLGHIKKFGILPPETVPTISLFFFLLLIDIII